MRFTLSSTQLGSCLSNLSKVIASKNSMPILNCFLFEVSGSQLTVTASDNENVMQSTITLDEYDTDGAFCLTSRTILDAIKELAEQPITVDIDLESLRTSILYLNGVYNIVALSPDDYPPVLAVENERKKCTIQSDVLSSAISRALFATGQDEIRPVMNGVYFDFKTDSLSIVATDGHKLVRTRIEGLESDEPSGFILPKKPSALLKNVLKKDDSEVVIRSDGRNAEIAFSGGKLLCRLTEGNYPRYESVIPTNNTNYVTINRKSLVGTLRRVLPFANDSSQLVRFRILPGKMEISSEDIDFSTSAKEMTVCEYDGAALTIGFKGTTLTEVLNNLESEDITFQLADEARAGIVVPSPQEENIKVLMLMMPMLLND